METETVDRNEQDFKTEIAKTFAISAATTAGFMLGFLTVGAVKNKLDARRAAKEARIANTTE